MSERINSRIEELLGTITGEDYDDLLEKARIVEPELREYGVNFNPEEYVELHTSSVAKYTEEPPLAAE